MIGVDRAEASRIAHGDLVLYNPLSEHALDEAIALLALPRGARVLDVACGRAEVLRRVAERYEVEPAGYDADPALVRRRPPELDVTLAERPPDETFDLVICIASSHALGGFPDALSALHDLVEPGGQVLLGEGYWRPPADRGLPRRARRRNRRRAIRLPRAHACRGGGRASRRSMPPLRAMRTGIATSGRRS